MPLDGDWDVGEGIRTRAAELKMSPAMRAFVTSVGDRKVGLVLAGGGAKGAFQAGALLALLDLGLTKYQVIAGTSVGALNAALFQQAISRQDRTVLLSMWRGIGLHKVMALSPRILLQLLMAVLYALLAAVTLRPPRQERLDADFDIVVLHSVGWVVLATVGLILEVGLLLLLLRVTDLEFVQAVALLVSVTVCVSIIDWVLGRVLGATPAIASNSPLRTSITALGPERLTSDEPPIVCTLGHKVALGPPLASALQGAIFPVYMPLAGSSAREASEMLLLSAALPHVFSSRRVHGKWCVDGGLVDNVPLLGAFLHDQHNPVDTVFVLHLSKLSAAHQNEASRCNSLAARALYGTHPMPAISVLLEDWLSQTEFHTLHPSDNLNGTLGTFDFRMSRARVLIERGYRETLDQVESIARTRHDDAEPIS